MNYPQPTPKAKGFGSFRPPKRERPQPPPVSGIPASPLQQPAVMPVANEKGWLRQQADDFMAIVTGVPNLLWHTAKSYGELDYGAVLDGLTHDPGAVAHATRETLGAMLEGATEHWRTKEGRFNPLAPIHRPILAGLDILTVASLGATAGLKAAPLMGKIAAATRGADAVAVAAKWTKAMRGIQNFPADAVKSGLGRIGRMPAVKPLLESVGWDADGLKANSLYHTAKLQFTGRSKDQLRPIVDQEIGKGMYDELIDIEAGYKALDPGQYPPEVVERMRELAKVVKTIEDDGLRARLRAASGEYTPEMLEGSRLNHLRERMRSKGVPEDQLTDDLVKAHRDQVYAQADAVGTGDIQRGVFWHAMTDSSSSFDDFMYQLLTPTGGQAMRKAGILERFMGRSKYQTNPNIRHHNYVRSHNDMLGSVAGVRTILRDPELTQPFRKNAIPEGRVEIPSVLPKNLDYRQEALSVVMNRIAKAEMKHGPGSPEAIAAAIVESGDELGDIANRMGRDIVDGLGEDIVLTVPRGVARFLELELAPVGGFGRIYDKGMNFWRDLVLTFMPRYYVNNLLGNSLLMLLSGHRPGNMPGRNLEGLLGREMRNANFFVEEGGLMERIGASPHMAKVRNFLSGLQYHTENKPRAIMALKRLGVNVREIELTDELAKLVGMEGGDVSSLERVMEATLRARELGVAMEGHILAEARLPKIEPLRISPGIPPEQRMAFAGQYQDSLHPRTAAGIRQAIEGQVSREKFLAQIEPLRAPVEEAYKWVERWLGPYGKITPFSRKYLRRVVPFWTFGSTMARLMFWMPMLRPGTTWLYSSMSQMALDAWEDERLPDYLRGSVWIGTGKNGMLYFSRLSGFNPLEMMSERKLGRMSVPALLDPTQGPLVGAVVKMVGGYDQFSHRPPPLEPDQMIDHQGRVWDLDAQGNATRISPQTGFLDALGEMIPQTAVLNDIMAWTGFQVPGRGPKLYQMPDGTMFNPRHWQWGLANGAMRSFGAAVTPIDLERARAQQRVQTIRMIRHLGKQAVRSADPEERAQFMKTAKQAIDNLKGKS